MSIYKKLHDIQIQTRGFGKDSQGMNYRYVSGTKVLNHIRALMDSLGLILKQEIVDIENSRQDYHTSQGKPKSEILSKVSMRFTWVDVETGEKDENLFGANGQNDWDKGVGSALTYAERYFILKYFHIPTDEDDIDNPEAKPADPTDKLTLEKAIELIKNTSTVPNLTAIFNANQHLHAEKKFTDALTTRKLDLQTK